MTMMRKIENLTGAEEAILAAAAESGAGSELHVKASQALREHGLPTRRVEAWHYTDLRARLKEFPTLASEPDPSAGTDWLSGYKALGPAIRLPVLNGYFLGEKADDLPDGLSVEAYAGAGFRDATDSVALLQTLLGQHGMKVEIADGAVIEKAIGMPHGLTGEVAASCRHKVTVGKGARASFVQRHVGRDGVASQSVTVTDLEVGDNAEAVWILMQQEGDAATHLAQLNVTLGEGSKLTILALNAGGALVRREINVVSKGEGSDLTIRGVNLIGGEAHIDVTTSLVHEVPNTVSMETFRNVVFDRGRGVFQGDIRVAQIAQKTDARMACNTLLLSDEAEFSAKPELEIFADDVQCAHGATVADIDPNHLFYLRARGVPEKEARAMLVLAFVEESFDEVEDETLRGGLNGVIEQWLEAHG